MLQRPAEHAVVMEDRAAGEAVRQECRVGFLNMERAQRLQPDAAQQRREAIDDLLVALERWRRHADRGVVAQPAIEEFAHRHAARRDVCAGVAPVERIGQGAFRILHGAANCEIAELALAGGWVATELDPHLPRLFGALSEGPRHQPSALRLLRCSRFFHRSAQRLAPPLFQGGDEQNTCRACRRTKSVPHSRHSSTGPPRARSAR